MKPYISSKNKALTGNAKVPGDKSISHRSLMLASQALGSTTISGLLEGEDVLNTASALRQMGVIVEKKQNGEWKIQGVGIGGLKAPQSALNMGNSGTSTRLLMGLVAPYDFTTEFTGDHSLSKRPMERVITPLTQMGTRFEATDGDKLPLKLHGSSKAKPISYTLPVASAQVKSAILLAGLNVAGSTSVVEPHATRDHTENMLKFFDIPVESISQPAGTKITVSGKPEQVAKERHITVPADPSSAAFPLVAALITPGSEVTLPNLCMNPTRIGLITTLKEMGASLEIENERMLGGEPIADIVVKFSPLRGVIVPAERAPSMIDEYPILAVAAAFAEGETVMHGLAELRVKESDRLQAVYDALILCGVKAVIEGDSLTVKGGKPKGGATVATHFDHRIAMSFLVLGLASKEPVTVDDGTAIATSFPDFIPLMNRLGADMKVTSAVSGPLVIAIDGPAASGKGTLARRLAEHYGLDYLDTGSLYRAVGMKLIYGGQDPNDKEAAIAAVHAIEPDDLANPRLRQERIGKAASVVSAFAEVRQALLDYQREFTKGPRGAVLDGRDIGTVVCPEADYKFFVTATLYARAKRRHRELEGQGIEVIFDSVLEDLRERDERDANRAIAPLVAAEDAIIIEASNVDAGSVFERAVAMIEGAKISASEKYIS